MSLDAPLTSKLRAYFRELPSGARAMLVNALQRADGEVPHSAIILGALRAAMRDEGEMQDEQDLSVLVLAPCARYAVPEHVVQKTAGVILQDSLRKVWIWLERDRIADDLARLRVAMDADPLGRAPDDEVRKAELAAVRAIDEITTEAGKHRDSLMRLTRTIGHERTAEDMEDIAAALRHRAILDAFDVKIDAALKLPADEVMPAIKNETEFVLRKARTGFPLALVRLRQRLGAPLAMLRFTVTAVGSASDERIRDNIYGAAIDLLLADADRAVARAQAARNDPDAAALVAAVRDFGTVLKALFAEIEIDARGPWMRRISALRKSMGEAVRIRLSDLTPRVNQLMRMRGDSKRGAVKFDEYELNRLDADVAILMTARSYAEEIALNAETTRVQGEIRELLESGTTLLIERLRKLSQSERAPVRERLDAIIRISTRVFGEEYADLIRKSIHVVDAPAKQAAAAPAKKKARA